MLAVLVRPALRRHYLSLSAARECETSYSKLLQSAFGNRLRFGRPEMVGRTLPGANSGHNQLPEVPECGLFRQHASVSWDFGHYHRTTQHRPAPFFRLTSKSAGNSISGRSDWEVSRFNAATVRPSPEYLLEVEWQFRHSSTL
jgi:hypothetical protein